MIEAEIERLDSALRNDVVPWTDMLVEEIVARWLDDLEYEWNDDRAAATRQLASGIDFTLFGDEVRGKVRLEIQWASQGREERRRIGKWIRKAVDKAQAVLRREGWGIDACNPSGLSFKLVSSRGKPRNMGGIQDIVRVLQNLYDIFRFD